MDIAILTPIEVEYLAVRKFLQHIREENAAGLIYEVGTFQGLHHPYSVVIRQSGSKVSDVALATEKIIQSFQPSLVLLVGIAGGIKDVSVGDVIVGTKAYGYESGKETKEGFDSRPDGLPYDLELIDKARAFARKNNYDYKVFFGPIASGDKVITSTDSPVYKILKKHFNDTLAVEMESIGFAKATLPYKHIRAMNIRGISDMIDNKTQMDAAGHQPVAADRAATFAFGLLKDLDFSALKIYVMDAKEMAPKILEFIFPILKMTSLKQIGAEFKEATNTTILEIWDKVKHLFIEETEELRANPEDKEIEEEVFNATKKKLRNALGSDDSLKKELENLLAKAEHQESTQGQINIIGSKNVVTGGNFNVSGDFRIGDG